MKKRCQLLLAFLVAAQDVGAQQSKVDFHLAPVFGFNVSMGTLHSDDRGEDFQSIVGPRMVKMVNLGIGAQLHFGRQWQATLGVARTYMGGAFLKKGWYDTAGAVRISAGRDATASDVTRWSATIERKLGAIQFTKKKERPQLHLDINAGLGLAYTRIRGVNQSDTPVLLPSLDPDVVGYEVQRSNGQLGCGIGVNTQFAYREKRFLKLGIWYHYTPIPAMAYHFTVQKYNYGKDDFHLLVTPHQFLLFAEFPIKLVAFRRPSTAASLPL